MAEIGKQMPSGLQLMLKSLGLDPQLLQTAIENIIRLLQSNDERLARIEAELKIRGEKILAEPEPGEIHRAA